MLDVSAHALEHPFLRELVRGEGGELQQDHHGKGFTLWGRWADLINIYITFLNEVFKHVDIYTNTRHMHQYKVNMYRLYNGVHKKKKKKKKFSKDKNI